MKFIFLIITLVPAVLCASIGTNERMTLLLEYTMDCVKKSGVSFSVLVQLSSSNDDPTYSDFLSCFAEKYLSANPMSSTTNIRAINATQYINLLVTTSHFQKCTLQSKISATTMNQIVGEKPPDDDPTYKKLLSCYFVKLGILTADGDIGDDATKVEKWLLSGSGQKVLDSIKTNCGDKKGETLQDTAVLVFNCMRKHNVLQ